MISILGITNYALVLFYGTVLTLVFSGLQKSKDTFRFFIIFLVALSILQIALSSILGLDTVFKIYPLVTHLPLILYLTLYHKKSVLLAIASVTSAYVFTIPRKWIGTTAAFFLGDNMVIFYGIQIILTLPLLYLIIKYISPSLKKLLLNDGHIPLFFSAIPILFYILDYTVSVYSDLLYSGQPAFVEFMSSCIVILYFLFTLLYQSEADKVYTLTMNKKLLQVKSEEAMNQLTKLQESQLQATIYRHDLRHHLQFIKTCIEHNKLDNALAYIDNTSTTLDASKIIPYCENTTANLVLSYYIEKAEASHISCTVNTCIPEELSLSSTDLCCLLSNALENALHSCQKVVPEDIAALTIHSHLKGQYLCMEITNSFCEPITFHKNIPYSEVAGHGIGVQSMISIIEKYHGTYSFHTEDHTFIFQFLIPYC